MSNVEKPMFRAHGFCVKIRRYIHILFNSCGKEQYMDFVDTSKDYEKLAQEIYKNIMILEGVENVDVLHDVKIKGKSGVEHQIDVFWKYKYAGIEHKVLIECKYYTNPVSLIHARNMLGLLTDIPNSQGVIITTQTYQSGVVDFSTHYGISLKIIRPPQGSDWDGCIQITDVEIKASQNNYLETKICIDGKDQETIESLNSEAENLSINTKEASFQDDYNSPVFMNEWLDRNIGHQITNEIRTTRLEPNNTYIILSSGKRVKVQSIDVTCVEHLHNLHFSVDAMDLVKAILKDFSSNETEYTLMK